MGFENQSVFRRGKLALTRLMELAVCIALDSGKESKACEVVVRRYWSRLDLLRKA